MSGPKSDKKAVVATGVELLTEISQIKVNHVSIAPYQLTPYDGYMFFIEKVKEKIPREVLLHLQPNLDQDATVEQILPPNFVCSLAMKWLAKTLQVEI